MSGSPSSAPASPGSGASSWVERLTGDAGLPPRESLPRYVAPLPAWLEDVALRWAWVIVAVNLVGTAFGF